MVQYMSSATKAVPGYNCTHISSEGDSDAATMQPRTRRSWVGSGSARTAPASFARGCTDSIRICTLGHKSMRTACTHTRPGSYPL